ncbi:hypothetical protein 1 [Beihai sobemo-like virus 14]|uniref:hypothetical protein 1 n=1 Tax=Beihai sobemo-like virus 14 TaxID=1922685 RepID=UPI00090B9DE0|nr:hypothetical protein 1 [Beihai sobemo-like virus 14]APG75738.1 hypothetical protein 1 [Beihai sobemo-like virus 14]
MWWARSLYLTIFGLIVQVSRSGPSQSLVSFLETGSYKSFWKVPGYQEVEYSTDNNTKSVCSVGLMPEGPRGSFYHLGCATCVLTQVKRDGVLADEFLTATHVTEDQKDLYVWRNGRVAKVKQFWQPAGQKCFYEIMILRVVSGASLLGCKPAKTVSSFKDDNIVNLYAAVEGRLIKTTGTIASMGKSAMLGIAHTANTLPGWSGAGIFTPSGLVAFHHHGIKKEAKDGKGCINTGYEIGSIINLLRRSAEARPKLNQLVTHDNQLSSECESVDTWNWFKDMVEAGKMEMTVTPWGDEQLYTFTHSGKRWMYTSDELPDDFLDEIEEYADDSLIDEEDDYHQRSRGKRTSSRYRDELGRCSDDDGYGEAPDDDYPEIYSDFECVSSKEKLDPLGMPMTPIDLEAVEALREAIDEVDIQKAKVTAFLRALSEAQIKARRAWEADETDAKFDVILQASADIDCLQAFCERFAAERESFTAKYNEVMQKSDVDSTLDRRVARKKKGKEKLPPLPYTSGLRDDAVRSIDVCRAVVDSIPMRNRASAAGVEVQVSQPEGLYTDEGRIVLAEVYGVKVKSDIKRDIKGPLNYKGAPQRLEMSPDGDSQRDSSRASEKVQKSSLITSTIQSKENQENTQMSRISSGNCSQQQTNLLPPRRRGTGERLKSHSESILSEHGKPVIAASHLIELYREPLSKEFQSYLREPRTVSSEQERRKKKIKNVRDVANPRASSKNFLSSAAPSVSRAGFRGPVANKRC